MPEILMDMTLGKSTVPHSSCVKVQDLANQLYYFQLVLGGVAPALPGDPVYVPIYLNEGGVLETPDGEIPSPPKIIYGLTTGAVLTSDTTFTIDGITSLTPGYTHATDPQTVANTFAMALSNNHPVFAIYDPVAEIWRAWYDTDTAGGGGGGTYFAGFGLELATDTFSVDDTGYAGSGYEIFGSDGGSVTWDTVGGWLQTLSNFADEDRQSISAESGTPAWYPMSTLAVGLVNGAVAPGNVDIVGDNFETLGGAAVPGGADDLQNTFYYGFDDNDPIFVAQVSDGTIDAATLLPTVTSSWHVIGSRPVAMALGLTQGDADPTTTITGDTFTTLWGKPPSSSETLQNPFKLGPDDDTSVWAVKFPGNANWYALQATPVEVDVITEITSLGISGGNLVLTYKTATITTPSVITAAASDTVTIAVTECA